MDGGGEARIGHDVMPSGNLVSKLKGFFPVRDDLRGDLDKLLRERVKLTAGDCLIAAGDKFAHMYLVEEGWMLRVRHMPDGGRQIVSIGLPGDFLCYGSLMFQRSEFDVVAKTPAALWRLETSDFKTMTVRYPGLAEALVWSSVQEEALLAERVVSLGRRDATQRLAHVLCEIVARLELIDQHDGGGVLSLPLIQDDFADILGISAIHVLRTFKRLTELGAVEYRSRRLVLLDTEKLRHIAGFEAEYMHYSRRKDALSLSAGP
jgi:CRP-like cAMP-binding protein